MATTFPGTPDRGASRAGDPTRAGRRRHDEHPRPEVVTDTFAAIRDGRARRFARNAKPMDAARAMLGRLRSR